jgi:putative hydrolase of the HAD superfamily
MPLTTILFDLDETLVPDEATTTAALVAACKPLEQRFSVDAAWLAAAVRARAREVWRAGPAIEYCQRIGIASWEGLWGDCSGDDASLALLSSWLPTYREEAWRRALADHGIADDALVRDLALSYPGVRRGLCAVYDDAAPVLAALRRSCRLGIVTNGAPALQREKLAASGLAKYFDAVVISGEVGAGKPDPRIFSHALSLLGARAAETALVGDSLERDVAGARGAGLYAVWLNRQTASRMDGMVPHAEITSLRDLASALAALG